MKRDDPVATGIAFVEAWCFMLPLVLVVCLAASFTADRLPIWRAAWRLMTRDFAEAWRDQ